MSYNSLVWQAAYLLDFERLPSKLLGLASNMNLSFDFQSSTLIIGKQDTILAKVLIEHCNFGLQVLDSLLLLAIDPTG